MTSIFIPVKKSSVHVIFPFINRYSLEKGNGLNAHCPFLWICIVMYTNSIEKYPVRFSSITANTGM